LELDIDVGHQEFNRGQHSSDTPHTIRGASASGISLHTVTSRASRPAPDTLSLADVTVASDHMAFAPRQVLYRQGDPGTHVFILKEGTARLTHLLADGRQASIGLRFEGDMLGLAPGPLHQMGAEALTAVLAWRISRRELERLFRQHSPLERHFIDLCARELATTQNQLIALSRLTAEERVAAFLISLAEAQDRRGHHGPIYDVPVTRGDVGELLGLTLETVSRAVSAFRRRGWLRPHGLHEVELLDRDALAALGAGEGAGTRSGKIAVAGSAPQCRGDEPDRRQAGACPAEGNLL